MSAGSQSIFDGTGGGAAGLGIVALGCVFIWPLLGSYRRAIAVQGLGAAAFASYFALLGSPTASAVCVISLAQLLIAASVRSRTLLVVLYGASLVLMALLVAATWHGLPSALAACGSVAGTIARLQRSTVRMKWMFLIGAPFWLAHNLLAGAPYALAVDLLSIASNGLSLLAVSGIARGAPARSRPRFGTLLPARLDAILGRDRRTGLPVSVAPAISPALR